MRAAFICLLVFCLQFYCSPVLSYEDGYLPLDKRMLSHRIPQKLIAESLQAGQSISWGKTKIAVSSSSYITILGSDNASKPWKFTAEALSGSVSVWSADLDNNGTQDLIVYAPTGGCAWSPTADFIALLFEKNGRPFPWVVDGYFEVDSHGVKDLLDLNHNGRAELVRQSRDDGYWISSFYEASSARWQRLSKLETMSLPLYTRFTYSANKQAIIPPANRHPFESDFSNNVSAFWNPGKQHFIEDINWPNVDCSEDPRILLSDGKYCSPKAWYATFTVVLDEPGGRRIAVLLAGNATLKLLQEISGRHLPVFVAGAREKPGNKLLSTELIFAQTKSNGAVLERSSRLRGLDVAACAEQEMP